MAAVASLPQRVEVIEVSPRDGLQNEAAQVSTEKKVELIDRLAAAGARRIEATSFVNPKRVPQMADAETLMAVVTDRHPDVSFSGLVLNRRGAERAVAAGCRELTYVVVTTETFSKRNQGRGIAETLADWREVAAVARASGMRKNLLIAVAFGCPFEGRVAPRAVLDIVREGLLSEPDEIGLADTIGVGTPGQVAGLFEAVRVLAPDISWRAHFHDTRHTGIANAYAAMGAGVTVFDASAGGIGGCPFAPRATGNIATEDLVYLLDGLGVATDLDGPTLAALDQWLADELGHAVPGALGKAGWFMT